MSVNAATRASLAVRLAVLGVRTPEVLLPAAGTDWTKWAVVACDQYSSEREYWKSAEDFVGEAPSTLRLIFPEAYLEDADAEERIVRIQSEMSRYLADGRLASAGEGLVLVERFTPFEEKPRVGLVLAVDLEAYGYGADSTSLIRPSEGTIVERLPPRMRIRRGATLELPHIMLLVDDLRRSLIEPIYAARDRLPALYDFELMLGSGRVRGWQVKDSAILEAMAEALARRAPLGDERAPLFLVGDGNHSLATAKAVWEEIKAARAGERGLMDHPARYALAELVNVYDEGLPFHPIHRVLTGLGEADLVRALGEYQEFEIDRFPTPEAAIAAVDSGRRAGAAATQSVACVSPAGSLLITFPRPRAKLAGRHAAGPARSAAQDPSRPRHRLYPRHRELPRPGRQAREPRPLSPADRQGELFRNRRPRRRHAEEDFLHGRSPREALLYRGEENSAVTPLS